MNKIATIIAALLMFCCFVTTSDAENYTGQQEDLVKIKIINLHLADWHSGGVEVKFCRHFESYYGPYGKLENYEGLSEIVPFTVYGRQDSTPYWVEIRVYLFNENTGKQYIKTYIGEVIYPYVIIDMTPMLPPFGEAIDETFKPGDY
jgi:hypothetical protein